MKAPSNARRPTMADFSPRSAPGGHDIADGSLCGEASENTLWVDVWFSPLEHIENSSTSYLSEEERRRLAAIPLLQKRQLFDVSRSLLRLCLSRYVGTPPEDIALATDEWGKPYLVDHPQLHFNLSHTTGALVIAVSRAMVGVDVESRTLLHPLARISRVLSPEEEAVLESADADEQPQLFMKFWTRREALLKAIGQGFAKGAKIPTIPPDLGPGYLLWVNHTHGWLLSDLRLPRSFYAALAVQCDTGRSVSILLHALPDTP